MKKELVFTLIFFGITLTANAHAKCEFYDRKFTKDCGKPEKFSCKFEVSDPALYFEQNIGTCQCLLSSDGFFKKHREFQLKKDELKNDKVASAEVTKEIKNLCENGKAIEVNSNGVKTKAIFYWDAESEICKNTYLDGRNGIVGDRHRFQFPGAYNMSLREYDYSLGEAYGKVKLDMSLFNLNVSREHEASCAGTYEQIIDRKINEEKRKSYADKERNNEKQYQMKPLNMDEKAPASESTLENN